MNRSAASSDLLTLGRPTRPATCLRLVLGQVDVLIIGGGVIGVATAYAVTKARPDLNILLLEGGTFGAISGRLVAVHLYTVF